MRIYSRKALHWEGYDLMLDDRRMAAIYEKDDNPNLFYAAYTDGTLSSDYYNIQRAREHATGIALKELNNADEETGRERPWMRLNHKEQGMYPTEVNTSPRASDEDYWNGPRDRLFWDWYWSFNEV